MQGAKIFCVRVRVYSYERVDVGGGYKETVCREHFIAERIVTTETAERAVMVVCNSIYRVVSNKCRVELESCTEVDL